MTQNVVLPSSRPLPQYLTRIKLLTNTVLKTIMGGGGGERKRPLTV